MAGFTQGRAAFRAADCNLIAYIANESVLAAVLDTASQCILRLARFDFDNPGSDFLRDKAVARILEEQEVFRGDYSSCVLCTYDMKSTVLPGESDLTPAEKSSLISQLFAEGSSCFDFEERIGENALLSCCPSNWKEICERQLKTIRWTSPASVLHAIAQLSRSEMDEQMIALNGEPLLQLGSWKGGKLQLINQFAVKDSADVRYFSLLCAEQLNHNREQLQFTYWDAGQANRSFDTAALGQYIRRLEALTTAPGIGLDFEPEDKLWKAHVFLSWLARCAS